MSTTVRRNETRQMPAFQYHEYVILNESELKKMDAFPLKDMLSKKSQTFSKVPDGGLGASFSVVQGNQAVVH